MFKEKYRLAPLYVKTNLFFQNGECKYVIYITNVLHIDEKILNLTTFT